MRKVKERFLPCNECLCARCSCLFCPYERVYRSLPVNAGCYQCMMQEREDAVTECEYFMPHMVQKTYKIRAKRKDPYKNLAQLLRQVVKELNKIR